MTGAVNTCPENFLETVAFSSKARPGSGHDQDKPSEETDKEPVAKSCEMIQGQDHLTTDLQEIKGREEKVKTLKDRMLSPFPGLKSLMSKGAGKGQADKTDTTQGPTQAKPGGSGIPGFAMADPQVIKSRSASAQGPTQAKEENPGIPGFAMASPQVIKPRSQGPQHEPRN